MPSLKEIKGRIASVNSTLKITSAMKMVSSAKLRKAQNAIGNMVPYERLMGKILFDLMNCKALHEEDNPRKVDINSTVFTVPREKLSRVALVCISSNTSLCGGFNASTVRETLKVIEQYRSQGVEVVVYSIGKKIADAMRKAGYPSPEDFTRVAAKPTYDDAASLGERLSDAFLKGEYDKVEFIYNHFKSAASQPTVRETYLPLAVEGSPLPSLNVKGEKKEETKVVSSSETVFIVEPDRQTQVEILLPKVLLLKVYTVLLDSQAAEHAARTLAMQTATDNGRDLLAELTLEYNKGRQQKITNEILDLEGGAAE